MHINIIIIIITIIYVCVYIYILYVYIYVCVLYIEYILWYYFVYCILCIYIWYISLLMLYSYYYSKEVWKSNFRQYGQMKSRDGKRQREEKSRREKIREEKESEERSPDVRKGRKVAKHCVLPMSCGSGGSKSRLAKAAGAEPSGQMRNEKVHAVVAQSTFASEKAKNTSRSERFWKLRCHKSARRCGAKHISKSKCAKHTRSGPLLEVEMSKSARRCRAKHISKSKCTKHLSFGALLEVAMLKKCTPLWRKAHFEVKMYKTHQARTAWEVEIWKKCTPLWRKAHFEVKMYKTPHVRSTFGGSDVVSRGRGKGLCTFSKWAKREDSVAFPQTMPGVGHLKRICKDAFSVAGAVQETPSSELLGGPGADFLRGFAFWSIRSSGLLRWFCVTGAALRMTWHHFFVAGAVV